MLFIDFNSNRTHVRATRFTVCVRGSLLVSAFSVSIHPLLRNNTD
jgi:hypothetical protein